MLAESEANKVYIDAPWSILIFMSMREIELKVVLSHGLSTVSLKVSLNDSLMPDPVNVSCGIVTV